MLEVSRTKVPTMDTLLTLIDQFSTLKYNQIQLYTEHTFAFSNHRQVWQDASPYTASDIINIRQYCEDRFIDLVPNLNSFGHFERWLRHPTYHHLAECPDGFIHPLAANISLSAAPSNLTPPASNCYASYMTNIYHYSTVHTLTLAATNPGNSVKGGAKQNAEKKAPPMSI